MKLGSRGFLGPDRIVLDAVVALRVEGCDHSFSVFGPTAELELLKIFE